MLNPTILGVDELAAKPIVSQLIDIDPNRPLQSPLTSLSSPILLEESTNQDNSTRSSELDGRHKPQKEAHISPDESRLLGTPRQLRDPNAVQIIRPSSKGGKEGMGHLNVPPGFRPTNTLKRIANIGSISPNNRYIGQDHANERKRPVLETATSTGDNVQSVSQHSEILVDLNDRSRPKRPKLESHSSSENYPGVYEEAFDPRQSDNYTVALQKSQGRSQEKGSQGPSNYSQAPGTGRCPISAEVKEFVSVEQTMKNGEKPLSRRRQHKIGNHLQPDYSSIAIEIPTSSLSLVSDSIQSPLQHTQKIVKPVPRDRYKGTAKTQSPGTNHGRSKNKFREQPGNGGQSRHLHNNSHPQSLPHDQDLKDLSSSKGQGRLNEPSKLNDRFFDSDGKRQGEVRSTDRYSISSDELAREVTVGDIARKLSPQKYSRSNSPIKSSSSNATGLERSRIPATKFTSSRDVRRPTKGAPAQQTTYPGENEASWSIELSCVNLAGPAGESVRGPNLALVFVDSREAYEIRNNGKNLTATNPSLQIQPKKIVKVSWANGSTKIRFLSSKTGSVDNFLDIEMSSEKDVGNLLEKIREGNNTYDVKNFDRNHMDKIFEHRQSQHKTYSRKANASVAQTPQDIQLAARNKERRDIAQDELSEPGNCKRRRGLGEADQAMDKPRLSRGMKKLPREPQSEIIFGPHLEELADMNGPRKIDRLFRSLHSESPNPHLRESRNKSEFEPRNSKGKSPSEEFPRHLRYSVTEGLGDPWSKPLLYPKTGKKKISVEWMDLERLDEGEFLNDNLIAFYLRFLQDQLEERSPELAKRVYFFNTFFFASLTNTQRGKRGINYEAVQKWTRSVDIFSYDYVVVPINESAHWYVAIICNLSTLASNPEVGEDGPKDEPPLSPDDHDDPNGLSTRSLGRDSGPAANFSVEESCLLLQQTEDSIEQVPSASFAEMSLEPDPETLSELGKEVRTVKNTADDSTSDGVGQAMLDMQIKGNMAESATLEQREASLGDVELEETKDDPIIVQNHSPKATPVSRKRKRKSVPPTQRTDPTIPLILTFDSLGLAHPPTVRILKDYLLAEGRAKRDVELDVSRIKGMTAKQIPQQDNMCDCGLFLLGYIDKFLDDPKDFITRVIGHKYDLEKDWPKLKPSDLRANIRTQIQALYAEQESERQDERRERAKRGNKHHERPLQHSDTVPSSNITQLKSNPSEASEALQQVLVDAAENPSSERPSTREMALKTTKPIDESLAQQALDIDVKQSKRSRSKHIYQDSSDPLQQDVGIVARRSQSPLLQIESSLFVIESQSDPAANQRSRSVSDGLPSTIADSQPSPVQDLRRTDEAYPKSSPPPSSIETDDPRSAGRGGLPELGGDEFDEDVKEELRTKQTAPEKVKIEHQPRISQQHKQTLVPEIVELDD